MTVIREEDIIMQEISEEPFDYSEIFDATMFPKSTECYLFDKDIAW